MEVGGGVGLQMIEPSQKVLVITLQLSAANASKHKKQRWQRACRKRAGRWAAEDAGDEEEVLLLKVEQKSGCLGA